MADAMRYEVRWAEQAVRDLQSIIAFVAQDTPLNASRLLKRLKDRAETLCRFPDRGRVVPELARFGIVEVRQLVVSPYRLIYRVDRATVIILALFDGRRDIGDVLFDRLLRS